MAYVEEKRNTALQVAGRLFGGVKCFPGDHPLHEELEAEWKFMPKAECEKAGGKVGDDQKAM